MRFLRWIPLAAAAPAVVLLAGCSSGQASYPVRTYPMGDRVELGHIIYTVFETQWMTHLGEAATARVPQNRFFLVRMSSTNSGSADQIMPSLLLQDDNGKTYSEVSNGDGVPQWIGFLRNVKPAESAQGNVLFDAPPRHYKLRITDETGDRVAFIDVPLTFGAETPEFVTPSDGK